MSPPPITPGTSGNVNQPSGVDVSVGIVAAFSERLGLSIDQTRMLASELDDRSTKLEEASSHYVVLSSINGADGFSSSELEKMNAAIELLNEYGYSYTGYSGYTGTNATDFVTRLKNDLDVVRENLKALAQQFFTDLQHAHGTIQEGSAFLASLEELFFNLKSGMIRNWGGR